ncbi:MAG: hypothetical protein KGO48_06955 [Alphaproteobacteria bacterium]|nr:hypothetical protein [Alphaproteobacteria bacterium]
MLRFFFFRGSAKRSTLPHPSLPFCVPAVPRRVNRGRGAPSSHWERFSHNRPDSHEIERCKWWNDLERRLVRPQLIVALGAPAARSLMGKKPTIQKVRGKLLRVEDDVKLVITVHPSSLLRIPVREDRHRQYDSLVEDLRSVGRYLEPQ